MTETTHPIEVELVGTDGNAFALIAKVRAAIQKEVGIVEASEFADEALMCDSYDELLRFIQRTVQVT